MEDQEEVCRLCGGAGEEVVGENRVTLDMAIDAGDRNMEGMFHSYNYDQCSQCGGSGVTLKFDVSLSGPIENPDL